MSFRERFKNLQFQSLSLWENDKNRTKERLIKIKAVIIRKRGFAFLQHSDLVQAFLQRSHLDILESYIIIRESIDRTQYLKC